MYGEKEKHMVRGINTRCLHLTDEEKNKEHYGSLSFPIYQTATYAHPEVGRSTGFDYSRLQNPTREHLEKIICGLEDGLDAFALSTGMAAITLLFSGREITSFPRRICMAEASGYSITYQRRTDMSFLSWIVLPRIWKRRSVRIQKRSISRHRRIR